LKNQSPIIKLIFISVFIAGMNSSVFCNSSTKPPGYLDKAMGLRYISVSGGAGLWYSSLQTGMDSHSMPYSALIEFGRERYPLSIIAGASIRATYNIDFFLLNPNNVMIGLQYTPLMGTPVSSKFNIYCMGGLNLSLSRFTENAYPGVVEYENKVERKYGAGIGTGLGFGYKVRFLEIKPVLFYFTGRAGFFAGHFTEQKFNTGSLQFHLMLNYRITFNPNRSACPVYRKHIR
jgi:hypothetical protein